jgi:co-chaperonin GroES (HSP10)
MTDIRIEDYDDEGIDFATFDKEAEIAKFKDLAPTGWTLLLRLLTDPEKTKGGLLLPPKAREEALYTNFVGLVVNISPWAYSDERYETTGPWCKIGDWVTFPRHSGYRMFVGNIPLWVLKEDAIDIPIKNEKLIPLISKYKY